MGWGECRLVDRNTSQSGHPIPVGGCGRELMEAQDLMRVLISVASFYAFCAYHNENVCRWVGAPTSLLAQSNHWLAVIGIGSVATYNHPSPVAQ